MMDVVVTTGAVGHAKLQSNRHHQQTNIHLTGKISHSMDELDHHNLSCRFSNLVFDY